VVVHSRVLDSQGLIGSLLPREYTPEEIKNEEGLACRT